MSTQKFLKKEAIQFGWDVMKKNFWFFVGILAFTFLISYLPTAVASGFEEIELPTIFTAIFFLVGFIFWAIQLVISMGLVYIAVKFVKGEKPVFNDLFVKANKIIDWVASTIVYSIIITVGFILLIVPGIIFVTRFQFYQYFIIDQNKGPIEALRLSWRITKGSTWNLILFGLLLLLINIAGALVLIVGLLATIPTTMVALAWVYKKLLPTSSAAKNA